MPNPSGSPKRTGAAGVSFDERRRKRRRALIDSALDHFAAAGYGASPIEQICQDAGVGYKAFYDEFGSKEDLFIAVYDSVAARVLTAVMTEFGPDVPPAGRPRVLMGAYLRAVLSDERFSRILFILSSGISERVELHKRRADLVTAGYVADLYREGLVSSCTPGHDVDFRSIGLAITGGISQLVVDFVLDDTRDDLEQLVFDAVTFVQTVFLGIEARSQPVRRAPSLPD